MTIIQTTLAKYLNKPATWLITGVAGFIGSNLLETLLNHNQHVIGIDNFATGFQRNLDEVKEIVGKEKWRQFKFIHGDIRDLKMCYQAFSGVNFVLHQAALGSVPGSLEDPIYNNTINIDGFLNMLVAARDNNVNRFVYAASSSTYGDHPGSPKVEDVIGKPLSPYAVTKYVNELYADVFARCYGLESIGLRYFNVFGPRQDPDGAYAAVIPKWIAAMVRNQGVNINGDGETSRDFCYIKNVVQANLQAATIENAAAINQIYNVAVGEATTLNQLFEYLKVSLVAHFKHLNDLKPIYLDFRAGDIRHSLADITKAQSLLGYAASYKTQSGLSESLKWYLKNLEK